MIIGEEKPKVGQARCHQPHDSNIFYGFFSLCKFDNTSVKDTDESVAKSGFLGSKGIQFLQ